MSKLIPTIIKEQQRVSYRYNSLAVHKLVLGVEGIKEYICLHRGCRRKNSAIVGGADRREPTLMACYVYKPKRSTLKLYDFMCSSLRFLHIVSRNFLQTF
jgi:hypothetical protein